MIKNDDTLDQPTKDLFNKIKEKYRNPWIHLDLEELEKHTGLRFRDPVINIASISAEDAKQSLKLLCKAISQLYPDKAKISTEK